MEIDGEVQTIKARRCVKCGEPNELALLGASEYRCHACGFELAHVDTTSTGKIRGVFGYLKSIGDMIQDRYRVQKVLGKGGFGVTYLVEDLKLNGKRRALKEIPELLFDEQEVNLLGQLHHVSIPDIIDRFLNDGMVYLVLEFGGSRTLGSHCQTVGGGFPINVVLPWMHQLCEALIYLHSQQPPVIHRDLKPDNILLDENDRIMLIDFGVAKEANPAETTRLMARAFTYGFSPPEQLMGMGTDERSDIYSLGATFYYLLTGEIPTAAHERLSGKELREPCSLVAELPAELNPSLSEQRSKMAK